jgi:hypothetical protein
MGAMPYAFREKGRRRRRQNFFIQTAVGARFKILVFWRKNLKTLSWKTEVGILNKSSTMYIGRGTF